MPKIGDQVRKDYYQIIHANYLSQMRMCMNRINGNIDNKVYCNQSDIDLETIGILGEMSFGELANVNTFLLTENKKYHGDCYYKGKIIEVKSCNKDYGELICSTRQAPFCKGVVDYFCLFVAKGINDLKNSIFNSLINGEIKSIIMEFRGYARASDLLNDSTLKYYGTGPQYPITHGLPQPRLIEEDF
jgi:hypothetical protein